jgi:hypothetical protein
MELSDFDPKKKTRIFFMHEGQEHEYNEEEMKKIKFSISGQRGGRKTIKKRRVRKTVKKRRNRKTKVKK